MPFKIIAITNRKLCAEPLPQRVAKLCDAGIDGVIVREKDLSEAAYAALLREMLAAVRPDQRNTLIVNTFADIARSSGVASVQLSLPQFQEHPEIAREFESVGVSIHSRAEARLAQDLGANYLIAGHIFPTGCKPDLAPRGIAFLREVRAASTIPVLAIGGIDLDTIAATKQAEADGACLMSGLMTCEDPASLVQDLRERTSL